jgi:phosphoglycolate phosphatase
MKAVIFDFDGTIADSLPGIVNLYESVRKKGHKHSSADIEKMRNMSMYQIALAMKIPKWKILVLAIWGRRLFKNHMRTIRVYPGMAELIAELKSRGIMLFVVSANNKSNVTKYLTKHGLIEQFDGVYGGASFLGKAKTMRKALAEHNLAKDVVWCVGDERVDIYSARKAGLKIISVSWGYSSRDGLQALGPDAIVDTMPELKKLLLGNI